MGAGKGQSKRVNLFKKKKTDEPIAKTPPSQEEIDERIFNSFVFQLKPHEQDMLRSYELPEGKFKREITKIFGDLIDRNFSPTVPFEGSDNQLLYSEAYGDISSRMMISTPRVSPPYSRRRYLSLFMNKSNDLILRDEMFIVAPRSAQLNDQSTAIKYSREEKLGKNINDAIDLLNNYQLDTRLDSGINLDTRDYPNSIDLHSQEQIRTKSQLEDQIINGYYFNLVNENLKVKDSVLTKLDKKEKMTKENSAKKIDEIKVRNKKEAALLKKRYDNEQDKITIEQLSNKIETRNSAARDNTIKKKIEGESGYHRASKFSELGDYLYNDLSKTPESNEVQNKLQEKSDRLTIKFDKDKKKISNKYYKEISDAKIELEQQLKEIDSKKDATYKRLAKKQAEKDGFILTV